MRFDYGYAEEDRLGKPYDLGLLKRLLPFLKPYRRLMVGSVILVVLITLFELALPYFSKIAIDRFIVPGYRASDNNAGGESGSGERQRELAVDLARPGTGEVVARHPDLFSIRNGSAFIAYENLDRLPQEDIRVLRRPDLEGLAQVVMIFLAVVVADFIFTFLQRMIMEYAGHKVMHDLRMRLFEHLQQQNMAFFDHQPVARLVTRVTNDVQNMHELFTTFIAMVFKDFFLLAGIAIVLAALDWRLALAGLAVLPIVIWAALGFATRARDVFRALRVKVAEINSRMAETIEGVRTIQTFGREEANYNHFAALNAENYSLGMRQIHIFAIFMPIIEVLGILAMAVVVLYGGLSVLGGAITLGALVAALSYLRMFFRPLRDLAENYNVLQNAMASAERIFALFDRREVLPQVAADEGQPGVPENIALKSLSVEHIFFSYAPGEDVLRDVSFDLLRGQTVALVGPTGSGKTSLINLILRLYDPHAGSIRINGRDIRQWDLASLRSMAALVPQDPILFSGTLRQNIFAEPDRADPDFVSRIVEAAHCRNLIERLPQGLDTPLVKGGSGLSSGERQLVTIARALARDPELILLDEATSYIDSQTEADVHKALQNLLAGRTGLIVAHRLSTARGADKIVVMRHGQVVEAGSHAALIERRGLYYRLTYHQEGAHPDYRV